MITGILFTFTGEELKQSYIDAADRADAEGDETTNSVKEYRAQNEADPEGRRSVPLNLIANAESSARGSYSLARKSRFLAEHIDLSETFLLTLKEVRDSELMVGLKP